MSHLSAVLNFDLSILLVHLKCYILIQTSAPLMNCVISCPDQRWTGKQFILWPRPILIIFCLAHINKWNPNEIFSVRIPCEHCVKNWEPLNLDQVHWFAIQLHSFMRSQRGTRTKFISLRSQCIVWHIPLSRKWCTNQWSKWTTFAPRYWMTWILHSLGQRYFIK